MVLSFPMCQCRGTVFVKIWWQVVLVAAYASALVMTHEYVPSVKIPWTLVPILGVATGMLLVFRTNTAYDRYWEARKLWSSMTTSIRNLTRNIWVGVKEPEDDGSKILVEKISALNILAAFSYATRNYLRGEYSYEDADLKYLLRHVPRFYNLDCKCQKTKKKTRKESVNEELEGIGCTMMCRTCYRTKKYKFTAYEEETPTNIPLELSYLLGGFIKNANMKNLVDPSLLAALNNALNALVECLTGFERILRTPIPLAYSLHLHHSVYIYILTLPPQLVEALGWLTPVATALAAFCLLGVLEIGWEIENPFGRDPNDLPLDDFCRVTHREIQRIMGRKIPSTDEWLMSHANRPLAPECLKSAPELAKLPADDVRSLTKRDTIQIKKYFENLAYQSDEPEDEKKKSEDKTKVDDQKPSTSDYKEKSDEQKDDKEEKDDEGKDDEEEKDDEQENDDEDEEEEEVEVSSKRVSFVLPDEIEEEGDEMKLSVPAELDEEDDESEGKIFSEKTDKKA